MESELGGSLFHSRLFSLRRSHLSASPHATHTEKGGGKEKGGEKGTIAAKGQSMHEEKEEGLNAEAEAAVVLFFKWARAELAPAHFFFAKKLRKCSHLHHQNNCTSDFLFETWGNVQKSDESDLLLLLR